MSDLLDLPQAAGYYKVSPRTLRRYVDEFGLAHYKIGRSLRFARPDLDAFLAEHCRIDPIHMGDI